MGAQLLILFHGRFSCVCLGRAGCEHAESPESLRIQHRLTRNEHSAVCIDLKGIRDHKSTFILTPPKGFSS